MIAANERGKINTAGKKERPKIALKKKVAKEASQISFLVCLPSDSSDKMNS